MINKIDCQVEHKNGWHSKGCDNGRNAARLPESQKIGINKPIDKGKT